MIQQSESLRIGNKILKNNKIITVKSIYESSDGDIDINNFHYSNFEPISITKKILLKCGFEWNGFMYSHSDDMVINDKISFVSIYNDKIQDDVMYDIPESLHELQNLYKSLRKKELHFKP